MGKKKLNNNYLKAYALVESKCQEKFGISDGGIDEYAKRLESARFAPNRDEVLGKLSAYQQLYRRFDTEPNAIRRIKEVQKDDIKWLKKFAGDLKAKKDPISRYLKSARKYVRGRKVRRVLLSVLILAIIAGAAVAVATFLL